MKKRTAISSLTLAGLMSLGLALPGSVSAHDRHDAKRHTQSSHQVDRYFRWHMRDIPRYSPYNSHRGWRGLHRSSHRQQRHGNRNHYDSWRRHSSHDNNTIRLFIDLSERF